MKNKILYLIALLAMCAGCFSLFSCASNKQTVVLTIITNNFLTIEPIEGKAGMAIEIDIPQLENNEFEGFYTDAEMTHFFGKTIKYLPEKNLTLYAKYTPASLYKVYFNSGGGSYVVSADVFSGDTLSSFIPAAPTKDGYVFVGWALGQGDSAELFDFSDAMPEHNITLNAKWERDYTKDYYKFMLSDKLCYELIVSLDMEFDMPPAPRMEPGFVFEGWYASPNSQTPFSFSNASKNELTIDEDGAYIIHGNYYYQELIISGNTVLGYNGAGSKIVIPWVKDGVLIQNIADNAFKGRKLKSIIIPDTIKSIGNGAFASCTELSTLTLPSSLESVGEDAFVNCAKLQRIDIPKNASIDIQNVLVGCVSLYDINIADGHEQFSSHEGGVYSADGSTFIKCAAARKEFWVKDGTTTIEKDAFDSSSLKQLTIADSVQIIESGAIRRETSLLTELTLPAIATDSYTKNGKAVQIFNLATIFGAQTYSDNMGSNVLLNSLFVPSSLHTVTLSSISAEFSYSFYGCFYIKKINLPVEGLRRIGSGSFYMCYSLEEIIIPQTVTEIAGGSIQDAAFYYCQNLKKISLPLLAGGFLSYIFGAHDYADSLSLAGQIMPLTFYLEEVEITDKNMTDLPNGAFFGGKNLRKISFASRLKTIGYNSFYDCNLLEEVDSLKYVEELKVNNEFERYSGAFAYCYNLKELQLPSLSRGVVGREAFIGVGSFGGAFGFEVGNGVLAIEDFAFMDCTTLVSIKMPASLISIGASAFLNCAALKSVVIPSGVRSIGHAVFENCLSLEQLEMPLINNIATSRSDHPSIVFSLPALFGAQGIDGNKYVVGSITRYFVPTSLKSVKFNYASENAQLYYSFYECVFVENIILPNMVRRIGQNTFFGCTSLTSFTLPSSVDSVDRGAFANCESLTSIAVNGANTYFKSIGGVLFSFDGREIVCYPAGRRGDAYAIPENVESVSDLAFAGNTHLKNVSLPQTLRTVGAAIFQNCTALSKVTSKSPSFDTESLGAGLLISADKTVLYSYFGQSPEVIVPSSIEAIAPLAFSNLQNLGRVFLGASLKEIGEYAFSYMSAEIIFDEGIAMEQLGKHSFASYLGKTIQLPSSLKYIGEGAFEQSMLETITIPSNVTHIADYAFFSSTSLTAVQFPLDSKLEFIGAVAFALCELTQFDIPKNLAKIGDYAFAYNKIETFDSANTSLVSIGEFAFYCNSLQSVTVSGGIEVISNGAFAYNAPLNSLTMEEGVKHIGDYAFCADVRPLGANRPLSMLSEINIPSSVESIGVMAFYGAGHYVVPLGENGVYLYYTIEVALVFVGDYNQIEIGDDAFSMVHTYAFFGSN